MYPNMYVWFIGVSVMDLILTWCILLMGGYEVNYLAHAVIGAWQLPGLLLYKFCLVMLVIVCCEEIGRRQPPTGRALVRVGVAMTCVPVVAALVQLLAVMHVA